MRIHSHPFHQIVRGALALAVLMGTLMMAQERFSTIRGVVKDASGAVIPGVSVTVVNSETGRPAAVETNETGVYIARSLEPGRYEIKFDKTGFARTELKDVVLALGRETTADAVLEIGATQQAVQVTEAAPLIDTGGVTVSSNVTSEEFNLLPKARSFQSVVLLSPGVNSGQIEGGFQINGASGAENQFFVDGVSTNSLIDGRSRQNGAFEFLQEVQVKTGGIDAEYGGALGGVVSAITKSGGNQFHGEAHYFYAGSGIAAGPVERLLLLNPYSNAGNDPRYVQDTKNPNNQHEVGGSLGGYLLKDRLWFFSSYSPQFVRRENTYLFSSGTERDTIENKVTSQQLFNKASWNAAKNVRVTASWLWTPTKNTGILPAYNGYGNSVVASKAANAPLKTQGWTQPQSNYSGQIDWTISNTSLLSFRGGRFWDNFRTWGIPTTASVTYQTSSVGVPDVPANLQQAAGYLNTPRTQQTFYDITTRTYFQTDFSKYMSGFLGSHDIKIGAGVQKNVNSVDVSYPGGGYVWVYWGTPLNIPGGGTDGGKYGYYEVDNTGTRGGTGGRMVNMYIQDHWRIHPRLSLTLGLRTENEHVPSFNRAVRDDAFSFGFAQKLSPRLGMSWDVTGKGKFKVYASYGRYYDWVKYETSRGTFGGDFWTVKYRSLDTTDVFSLSGVNMPGRNIWPFGDYEDRRLASFDAVAKDLKPMSTDIYNAGVEYMLSNSLVFRAGYVRNHLVRTIEDLGALVNGSETYIFANPGEGDASKFAVSTATPVFDTPKPQRDYDALELSVNKRFSNRFFASANYVYSRLYGNYAGLGNSDEIRTPTTGTSSATTQQSGGSIARTGSTGSRAWDLDQYLFDAHGNFVNGRLATDRPHVFKAYGSYKFAWGTDIGGFYYAGSGTPMSTVVMQRQRIPLFVEGRGSMGRTPLLTQTDLVVGHEVKFGETKRLRFEFNAQNVFNQKTSRHTFNQLNRGNASGDPASALDLTNTNLFNGYDYLGMLKSIASTGKDPYDPRYGMADLFNPGFSGRVMVKFIF
ncbi:TonB-dependent receptor [uncultured Paludibaculum sp.]|uniref:TonB-dependent receptor n=1 Tax=uncultured Paludibaculum sp. TaxID=1765020 RepID=UPI002AAB9AFA|nr:TonB-dependent receptor [uncultured Paludibaculum sp.]